MTDLGRIDEFDSVFLIGLYLRLIVGIELKDAA